GSPIELARVASVPSSAPRRSALPAHTRVSATGAGSMRPARTVPPTVGRGSSAEPTTAAVITPTATRPLTIRAPTKSPAMVALRGARGVGSLIVAPVEGVGGVVACPFGARGAHPAERQSEEGGDSEQDAVSQPHRARPRLLGCARLVRRHREFG